MTNSFGHTKVPVGYPRGDVWHAVYFIQEAEPWRVGKA